MQRFKEKSVLVTGGSSGIGLATAHAFVAAGAQVVITGRDPVQLDIARSELGPRALAIVNETGSSDSAQLLAKAISEHGIRLDALFLNSGVARLLPLELVTESLWDEIFSSNVKGAFFQIQALRSILNQGASIVLNGSINAHVGMSSSSVYAASKAALISLARTLSAELLKDGIRVNVVSPGPVDTALFDKLGLDSAMLKDAKAHVQSMVPLGRFATPNEISATVLHLAASESSFIVGTEILIDGGMSSLAN